MKGLIGEIRLDKYQWTCLVEEEEQVLWQWSPRYRGFGNTQSYVSVGNRWCRGEVEKFWSVFDIPGVPNTVWIQLYDRETPDRIPIKLREIFSTTCSRPFPGVFFPANSRQSFDQPSLDHLIMSVLGGEKSRILWVEVWYKG